MKFRLSENGDSFVANCTCRTVGKQLCPAHGDARDQAEHNTKGAQMDDTMTNSDAWEITDKFEFLQWLSRSHFETPTKPEEAEEIVTQWMRHRRQLHASIALVTKAVQSL